MNKDFFVEVCLKVRAKDKYEAGNKVYNQLGFIHSKPLLGISYIGIGSSTMLKNAVLKFKN